VGYGTWDLELCGLFSGTTPTNERIAYDSALQTGAVIKGSDGECYVIKTPSLFLPTITSVGVFSTCSTCAAALGETPAPVSDNLAFLVLSQQTFTNQYAAYDSNYAIGDEVTLDGFGTSECWTITGLSNTLTSYNITGVCGASSPTPSPTPSPVPIAVTYTNIALSQVGNSVWQGSPASINFFCTGNAFLSLFKHNGTGAYPAIGDQIFMRNGAPLPLLGQRRVQGGPVIYVDNTTGIVTQVVNC
tara:strand:- start:50 stop:784 length:735 start_codon:yes stop_codon:yes gene_type:complete